MTLTVTVALTRETPSPVSSKARRRRVSEKAREAAWKRRQNDDQHSLARCQEKLIGQRRFGQIARETDVCCSSQKQAVTDRRRQRTKQGQKAASPGPVMCCDSERASANVPVVRSNTEYVLLSPCLCLLVGAGSGVAVREAETRGVQRNEGQMPGCRCTSSGTPGRWIRLAWDGWELGRLAGC